MTTDVRLAMRDVMDEDTRSSTWSITWTCWRKSREPWRARRPCSSGGRRVGGRKCLDRIWHQLEQRHGKSAGTREMIGLVRVGSVEGWDRLIAAVEEALHLGVTDAAAVLHIFHMPDAEQRRQYAITLAEELARFERPMPVMDDYDLLLAGTRGGTQ